MKLGWRIWLLSVFVALSVMFILSGGAGIKFGAFLMVLAIPLSLQFIKEKYAKIGAIVVAVIILLLLIYSSLSQTGVVVKSIEINSTFSNSGITQGEIIKSINGEKISSKTDYTRVMGGLLPSQEEIKIEIKTNKGDYIVFTKDSPTITVDNVPITEIQTGLDLRGGARALVQPDANLTSSEMDDLIQVARNRFNVYGLADVNIRAISDLDGNKYMLIEVAGATPSALEELIAQQGKFEAKVGNQTVFIGGDKDISGVCRNRAECSGITSCEDVQGGAMCQFRFAVYLRPEAAQKHADITANLSVDSSGEYLSEKLYLYVDGKEVDSLLISTNLKGQVASEISIQGSGQGKDQTEALLNARESMHRLQTILITGSLPYKLNIVKLDTISPLLGADFIKLILIAGAAAIVLVSLVVFIKYRKVKASLAVLLTSFSEVLIILGGAAFFNWNLDLPSIAGILATIGTGVDQQIVILDEAERGEKTRSVKERMKSALFIVVAAFATAAVSLLPLFWAGGGLFKGFMISTLAGITIGVLITRPAFSEIIRMIEGE